MTKKSFKLSTVVVIAICLAGFTVFSGCKKVNPIEPQATKRYVTVPVGSKELITVDGKSYVLAYSSKDESHWYYLYYMGYVTGVPISYKTAYRYDGVTPITITWEKSWATEMSIVESMTRTKESTWKTSASLTVGMEVGGKAGVPFVAEGEVKASISATISGEYGQTTTTSNTWETTQTKINGESESISVTIGENGEAPGRYRYAYFGTTDVYCLFKVDPATREVLESRIINCARASSFGWGVDFEPDENGDFGKTGEGNLFEIPNIDFSKLPEPTNIIEEEPGPPPPPTIDTYMFAYTGIIKGNATNEGGDNDINSKKGQNTKWEFYVNNAQLINARGDGTFADVKLSFTYRVREDKPDWTVLSLLNREFIVSLAGRKVIELRSSPSQQLGGTLTGAYSSLVEVGTWDTGIVRLLEIVIDGPGNDKDNIAFRTNLCLEFVEKNN